VCSQDWPSRPVHLVVPYAPGGPVDLSARLIAPKLQQALGQPLVVENKPGAGGNIGADFVAKSAPDGYTLVIGAIATHAINPALYASLPYDPVRDFSHIALLVQVPNGWRWRSASPASSTSPPAPPVRSATSRASSSSS
jgi:tripartite-type tricarboxylate transporter receptor subunit TctC